MNKHLISAGHVKINPDLLDIVLNDCPNTPITNQEGERQSGKIGMSLLGGHHSGNTAEGNIYSLCYYSRKECNKSCYKPEQDSCPTYRYLTQVKSYENKEKKC